MTEQSPGESEPEYGMSEVVLRASLSELIENNGAYRPEIDYESVLAGLDRLSAENEAVARYIEQHRLTFGGLRDVLAAAAPEPPIDIDELNTGIKLYGPIQVELIDSLDSPVVQGLYYEREGGRDGLYLSTSAGDFSVVSVVRLAEKLDPVRDEVVRGEDE